MTTTDSALPRSGWIDRTSRVRVEIQGPDRNKFLHNLVTNDIKALKVGQGCEAFITTPQGKTLAYVQLSSFPESILLRSDEGQADTFLGHLQKYGVFETVEIDDRSESTFEMHVFGELSETLIQQGRVESLAHKPLASVPTEWLQTELRWIRESPGGRPGVTVVGPIAARDSVQSVLEAMAPGGEVSPSLFETMRIEAGTPISGQDVSPSNLPQEVGRDLATISFVKGCYLGQETVARLDALGHVNKILKGLRIASGALPEPGATLLAADGKSAGTITSAALMPGKAGVIALGYIRVAHANSGTALTLEVNGVSVNAVVADLPMT